MRTTNVVRMCLCCVLSSQLSTVSAAVVTGILRGDDGTVISGGMIGLYRLTPFPPGKPRKTEWSATSGAGGAFVFDRVYEGRYRLCVQVSRTVWLNPCEWGFDPSIISLSRNQPSVNITLTLKKGAIVPIRIIDAGQQLARHEGKTPGAHLFVGLSDDALVYRPALVTAQDAGGRDQQIVIPFDTPVKVVAFSSFFHISDAAGLPLSRTRATKISVIVPSGRKPDPINLIVTGAGK
jgi:hypothetical protein